MKLIRKITIGIEYKNGAMHYTVGTPVSYNAKMKDYVLREIIEDKDGCTLYIQKNDEVLPWKFFSKQMGYSLEFDIDSYAGAQLR